MFISNKRGQSILEYTILLGVVVAALLVMQSFVKRGFQGGLKSSADKMGETFSAGNTTISQNNTMENDQEVVTEVNTGSEIKAFRSEVTGTADKGVYSMNTRGGATVVSEQKVATDAATQEKTRWNEFDTTTVDNFAAPF